MLNVQHEKTPIRGVLIIGFSRYSDERGFFGETLRISDLPFIKNLNIVQINESYSVGNVIRGLHFQWNPYMGKIVRLLRGEFYDLIVDIRKGSPTFGKGIIIKLTRDIKATEDKVIWLPPGIAHGFFCLEDCVLEYYCTGEYSGSTEDNISPLAKDIDWSLSNQSYYDIFKKMQLSAIITDKDRDGATIKSWSNNANSSNFIYDSHE